MSTPYIVHAYDQDWQPADAHRAQVVAYPNRQGPWPCRRCGRVQAATVARYVAHNPARCTGGPDSLCFHGPYCPHCCEIIGPDPAQWWLRDRDCGDGACP